jgi:hypothetical protein
VGFQVDTLLDFHPGRVKCKPPWPDCTFLLHHTALLLHFFTALYCTFNVTALLHLKISRQLHFVPPLLHCTALCATFTARYCTLRHLHLYALPLYCTILHVYCTFTAPYCTFTALLLHHTALLLHPAALSRPFHSKFNNFQIKKVESIHDCCPFALGAWGTIRVRTAWGWGGVGVGGGGDGRWGANDKNTLSANVYF